jgi:hypothetical protein
MSSLFKEGKCWGWYQMLVENIRQFKELSCMPIPVNIDQLDEGNGIEDTLKRNKACWHKSCRCKINTIPS